MKKDNTDFWAGMKGLATEARKELDANMAEHREALRLAEGRSLESLKKAELVEYARAMERCVFYISYAFGQVTAHPDVLGEAGKIYADGLNENRAKHSKGAAKTKRIKDNIWEYRQKRFDRLRPDSRNKTEACTKLMIEEEKAGRKIGRKTLMLKLKE